MIDLPSLILTSNDLLLVLLIFLIFFANTHRNYKFVFILLNLSLLVWSVSLAFYYRVEEPSLLLLVGKINFVTINLATTALYFFTRIFPKQESFHFKKLDFVVLGSLTIIPLILFTDTVIIKEIASSNGERSTLYGPLYFTYIVHLLMTLILSFLNLYANYHTTIKYHQVQIKYLVLGLLISLSFGLTTNLFLPLLGIFNFQVLGPLATLILSTTIGFLVVRHNFLSINVYIGKVLNLLILGGSAYATFYFISIVENNYLGGIYSASSLFLGVPLSIVFIIIINNLNQNINRYITYSIVNRDFNPVKELNQLNRNIQSEIDLSILTEKIYQTIKTSLGPSYVTFYFNENSRLYTFGNSKTDFSKEVKFINVLTNLYNNKTIIFDELLEIKDKRHLSDSKEQLIKRLSDSDIALLIKVSDENRHVGTIVIGNKEEGSHPYLINEIEFLESISDITKSAWERSNLYDEINTFNITLKKKIEDATSALKDKNKELEVTLLKLEEVRRQEKDMLDVMGHELRTPISIARNSVVTLQKHISKNDADPEKLTKYTKMAVESIRREIALIETFLSTTKLEGGRMQVNFEKVSLKDVIHESLEGHVELSKRNNTKVIFNEPENDIYVIADKIRIQEVMDNFLNNAIKYTGEGNVEINMYEESGLGWVEVKDDGIGISAENLEKLGRKFFRAQTLYNQSNNVVNPSGTGLGLFVSFQLIDLMKGKRRITSQEGQGSTFSFGLPITQEFS